MSSMVSTPVPELGNLANEGHRVLSSEQLEELRKSIAATTVAVPESYFEGKSYDELLAERLGEELLPEI